MQAEGGGGGGGIRQPLFTQVNVQTPRREDRRGCWPRPGPLAPFSCERAQPRNITILFSLFQQWLPNCLVFQDHWTLFISSTCDPAGFKGSFSLSLLEFPRQQRLKHVGTQGTVFLVRLSYGIYLHGKLNFGALNTIYAVISIEKMWWK